MLSKPFRLAGIVIFLAAYFLGGGVKSANAQARQRPYFQSTRALAMGDAYTAFPDGYEAVFYNPAGLAQRNRSQFKLVDFEMIGSQTLTGLSSQYQGLTSLKAATSFVTSHPDTPVAIGLTFAPQFIVKNFSFGLIGREYYEAYGSSAGDVDFFATSDFGGFAHLAFAMWGGIIKVGGGVKILDRAEINKAFTAADLAGGGISFQNQWTEGLGVGADAGITLTLPIQLQPTFAVSVLDIGDTTFQEKQLVFSSAQRQSGAPRAIKQSVNAAMSINVKHVAGVRSVITLEYKDVLAHTGRPAMEAWHAGWEFNIEKTFYLRAGLNQGYYWTGGLGIDLKLSRLELASYGEDVRFGNSGRRDDRKYALRYILAN